MNKFLNWLKQRKLNNLKVELAGLTAKELVLYGVVKGAKSVPFYYIDNLADIRVKIAKVETRINQLKPQ